MRVTPLGNGKSVSYRYYVGITSVLRRYYVGATVRSIHGVLMTISDVSRESRDDRVCSNAFRRSADFRWYTIARRLKSKTLFELLEQRSCTTAVAFFGTAQSLDW